MLSIIFLLYSSFLGWIIIKSILLKDSNESILHIVFAVAIGSFISVWFIFLLAIFIPLTKAILVFISLISLLSLLRIKRTIKEFHVQKIPVIEIILVVIFVLFSYWFAFQTLYSTSNGIIHIGKYTWGDFGVHLPLIRSFSWGDNIPPTAPNYPNQPLTYHFLFDFWAAILEVTGIPLVTSLNMVSIISFVILLFLIYKLPQLIFGKRILLGIISVLLFLFNCSFGVFDTLKAMSPSSILDLLIKIFNNNKYYSLYPFEKSDISNIWSLNTYANQRHFIFGLAIALIILYLVFSYKKNQLHKIRSIAIGIIWGLLPFWHSQVFLSLGMIFAVLFLLNPHLRKMLFIILVTGSILATPQLIWQLKDIESTISFHPGFITYEPLTVLNFAKFWILNLGFSLFFIPLSFMAAEKKNRALFIAFMSLFVIANLIQFSIRIYDNHKFINIWLLGMNFYVAHFLSAFIKKRKDIILFTPVFLIFIFSGIIDFMVLKNEPTYEIPDYQNNYFMRWVRDNTPKKSIFLIPTDETAYNAMIMVGRHTFQYRPYYVWTYGYDLNKRHAEIQFLMEAPDINLTIAKLKKNKINYVLLPKYSVPLPFKINNLFYDNCCKTAYEDTYIKIIKTNLQ